MRIKRPPVVKEQTPRHELYARLKASPRHTRQRNNYYIDLISTTGIYLKWAEVMERKGL